jgi:hypothetical protein
VEGVGTGFELLFVAEEDEHLEVHTAADNQLSADTGCMAVGVVEGVELLAEEADNVAVVEQDFGAAAVASDHFVVLHIRSLHTVRSGPLAVVVQSTEHCKYLQTVAEHAAVDLQLELPNTLNSQVVRAEAAAGQGVKAVVEACNLVGARMGFCSSLNA